MESRYSIRDITPGSCTIQLRLHLFFRLQCRCKFEIRCRCRQPHATLDVISAFDADGCFGNRFQPGNGNIESASLANAVGAVPHFLPRRLDAVERGAL
ncbi:MAG: hypothetical protein PHI51_00660 [Candidatus Peribacteraceae bacterium]|nr:hypothetical protein [Candidatus Peribacteraceae bacterium]